LPRRTVLKWFAAVAAAAHLTEIGHGAQTNPLPAAKGYGMDPDLSKFYQPGDFWPLTLTAAQRETLTTFGDLLFPADHLGPAASEVRVPDFLDEWVSAPYPVQQKDRDVILPGLQWLEDEAQKRFTKKFEALSEEQKRAIADDICLGANAKPEFKKAAAFFLKFRSLAASAYYGTEAGWKAIGYVGNTPLASFDGPPAEVLAKLGLEQTVKG
jgi:hypothetical protein